MQIACLYQRPSLFLALILVSAIPQRAGGDDSLVATRMKAVQELIDRGLAKVVPTGDALETALATASSSSVSQPTFCVSGNDELLAGRPLKNTDGTFNEVQILWELVTKGACKTVAFEGLPYVAGGMKRFRLVRSKEGEFLILSETEVRKRSILADNVVSPAEARSLLSDKSVFHSLAKRKAISSPIWPRGFALMSVGCPDEVILNGSEDSAQSETLTAWRQVVFREHSLASSFFLVLSDVEAKKQLEESLAGLAFRLASPKYGVHSFNLDRILATLEFVIENRHLDHPFQRKRIEFALKLDVDVVVLNHRHREYVDALINAKDETVVKLIPTGSGDEEVFLDQQSKYFRELRPALLALKSNFESKTKGRTVKLIEGDVESIVANARTKLGEIEDSIDVTGWNPSYEKPTVAFVNIDTASISVALCDEFVREYSTAGVQSGRERGYEAFERYLRTRGKGEIAASVQAIGKRGLNCIQLLARAQRSTVEDESLLEQLSLEARAGEKLAESHGIVLTDSGYPWPIIGSVTFRVDDDESTAYVVVCPKNAGPECTTHYGVVGVTVQSLDAEFINRNLAKVLSQKELFDKDGLIHRVQVASPKIQDFSAPEPFLALDSRVETSVHLIHPGNLKHILELVSDAAAMSVSRDDVDRVIGEVTHGVVARAVTSRTSELHPQAQKFINALFKTNGSRYLSEKYVHETLIHCYRADGQLEKFREAFAASDNLILKVLEASFGASNLLVDLDATTSEEKRNELGEQVASKMELVGGYVREIAAKQPAIVESVPEVYKQAVLEALPYYAEHYVKELEKASEPEVEE